MPLDRKGQCVPYLRSPGMADRHYRDLVAVAAVGLDLGHCIGLVVRQLVVAGCLVLGRYLGLAVRFDLAAVHLDRHLGRLGCGCVAVDQLHQNLDLETGLVDLVPDLDQMQNQIDPADQTGFDRLGYHQLVAADRLVVLVVPAGQIDLAAVAFRYLGRFGTQTGFGRSGCP